MQTVPSYLNNLDVTTLPAEEQQRIDRFYEELLRLCRDKSWQVNGVAYAIGRPWSEKDKFVADLSTTPDTKRPAGADFGAEFEKLQRKYWFKFEGVWAPVEPDEAGSDIHYVRVAFSTRRFWLHIDSLLVMP